MAKRVTKAQIILEGALERVEAARNKRDELFAQQQIAQAVYDAEQKAYYALSRALAREPRKPKAPKSPAQNVGRRSSPKDVGTKPFLNTEVAMVGAIGASGD